MGLKRDNGFIILKHWPIRQRKQEKEKKPEATK
jgi:hypothetical protein